MTAILYDGHTRARALGRAHTHTHTHTQRHTHTHTHTHAHMHRRICYATKTNVSSIIAVVSESLEQQAEGEKG